MQVKLDGQTVFDDEQVQVSVGSLKRSQIERTAAGLNGLVSIDLGNRGRLIKQTGVLRAASRQALAAKIDAVEAFIDGDSHTLTSCEGEVFGNVRMDSFTVKNKKSSGSGLCCQYEAVYTQLKVS